MPRIVSSSAGSSARNSSRSKFGIEKGLCEKSILFSSSFHSYIGKSTIQQNSKTPFFDESSVHGRCVVRAEPAKLRGLVCPVAGEEYRVASL